ncbi:MAG TPA: ribbon-helix-helix protein, CopG family [Chloroflexota bacterium]|jgi:predicted transcriptional regulator
MPDRPPLLSMRLDDTTRERLDQLAAHLGLNRSNVIRLAIQRLHQAEGLDGDGGKAAA